MREDDGGVAQQVWQEFSPREGAEVAFREDFRDNGLVTVTVGDFVTGFDMDPDTPFALLAAALADKMQEVVMEGRQEMVPDCPLHPAAHPLESEVVDGAAAWVCPSAKRTVRLMRVTSGAA